MTPARLREIVVALRSPEGWAGSVDEVNEAFFALADLAGIDRQDADLETIEARANAATPGPWCEWEEVDAIRCGWKEGLPPGSICIESKGTAFAFGVAVAASPGVADAAFIIAARADVPALVARVRRAEARLARAEDTIADMRAVLHDAAVDDDER